MPAWNLYLRSLLVLFPICFADYIWKLPQCEIIESGQRHENLLLFMMHFFVKQVVVWLSLHTGILRTQRLEETKSHRKPRGMMPLCKMASWKICSCFDRTPATAGGPGVSWSTLRRVQHRSSKRDAELDMDRKENLIYKTLLFKCFWPP